MRWLARLWNRTEPSCLSLAVMFYDSHRHTLPFLIGLYQIPATASPEFGHFFKIRPSPAPAAAVRSVNSADKTNTADLSSDVYAVLISVTRMIIQNLLQFHKFRQKLANGHVTKEALNCAASL